MSTETQLLQRIADDVAEIRTRLAKLEITFDEVNTDLHEVKLEYVQKLHRIGTEKTVSQEEFEKQFGVKI